MNTVSILRSAMLALTVFVSGTGYAGSAEKVSSDQAKLIKNQVNVGLDMAAYAKLSVSEIYIGSDKWPNNNDEAKVAPVIDTDFTIKVGNSGVITVTYLDPAELAGKSLMLTPSAGEKGTVNWACKSVDIPAVYLPKRCQ